MKEVMIDLVEELREYIKVDFNILQDRILNGELQVILKEVDTITKGNI